MKELKAILVSIPWALTFLYSGFIITLIQAACYLIIRPVSRNVCRQIIGVVTEILWLQIVWLADWWAGMQVQLYTDKETYELMGKERALVMPNHISDMDTSTVMTLAQRSGCLRGALAVVKKATVSVPVYGWAAWFFEFVFLDRNWAKDEKKLKTTFEGLRDFPRPFWLTIFIEGTRMTPDKLLEAQQFAASKGFPVPKNVLIPRTKGFVAAVQHMRSFVPAVYDVTLVVPKGYPTPSTFRVLLGKPTLVKIHVKRYSMKELPETEEGIAQWCRDRFVAKDAMIEKFYATGTLGDNPMIKGFDRSLKSLLIPMTCVSVCCLYMVWLASTWKGCAFLATTLVFVVFMVRSVIEFTKLPPQKGSLKNPNI